MALFLVMVAEAQGCTCGSTDIAAPLPERVEPDQHDNQTPVEIRILGRQFYLKAVRQLEGKEEFKVDERFSAVLSLEGQPAGAAEVVLEAVRYIDASTLQARVPAGIQEGSYGLTVTGPYRLSGSLPGAYTVTPIPPPEIARVDPGNVVNDAPTGIAVAGANFQPGLELRLGERDLEMSGVASDSIQALVPAGFAQGSYRLTVRNPDGQEAYLDDAVSVFGAALLAARLVASAEQVRVGEMITLTLWLSNQGQTAALGVSPLEPVVTGGGLVERVSGPDPGEVDLGPGGQEEMVWSFGAVAVGEMFFEIELGGTNQYSGRPVGAGPVRAGPVSIKECFGDGDCMNPAPICSSAGLCVACANDGECLARDPNELFCDVPTGSCLPCLSSAQCGGGYPICDSRGVCVACRNDGECASRSPASPWCEVSSGACRACLSDLHCEDSNPCTKESCEIAVGCLTDPLAAGTDCGVCAACDGAGRCLDDLGQDGDCPVCRQCAAGSACVNQAAGSDLKNECSAGECNTGACDGAGGCGFVPAGTSCIDLVTDDCNRAQCDGAGICDQSHAAEAGGYVCRPAAGVCDVAERCAGADGPCPADLVEPDTVECRSSPDPECDLAENCDGANPVCPADSHRLDGAACLGSDANECNSSCQGGVCTDGALAESGEPCGGGFDCLSLGGCSLGACVGGGPNDAYCEALNPGDLCRPQCFGGTSGCGTPPVGMTLGCLPRPVDLGVADTAVCGLDLGLTGQADCLYCYPEVGITTLDYATFEGCDLTGWSLVPGNVCSDSVENCILGGALNKTCCSQPGTICQTTGAGSFLRTDKRLNCGGGREQWRMEKTFDFGGLSQPEVCFEVADIWATENEGILIYAADGIHGPENLFCLNGGPQNSVDGMFYQYCTRLPAWAEDNPAVTIRFVAHSENDGEALYLDNILVQGWYRGCAPVRTTALVEDFAGCSDPLADGFHGWKVSGEVRCTSSFSCYDLSKRAEANLTSGSLERHVDVSMLSGDVRLCFFYGDDGGGQQKRLMVDFDAGTGWQTAWDQAGNPGPDQSCREICVNLSRLDPAVDRNSDLGIRLNLITSGDRIALDQITLSGARYCDGTSFVSLGAPSDNSDGTYTFTARDDTGSQLDADIFCSWDAPPAGREVEATDSVWYRP